MHLTVKIYRQFTGRMETHKTKFHRAITQFSYEADTLLCVIVGNFKGHIFFKFPFMESAFTYFVILFNAQGNCH